MKIVTATKAGAAAFGRAFKSVVFSLSDGVGMLWRAAMASWGQVSYATLTKRAFTNPTSARALSIVAQLMADVPFTVEHPDGEMEKESDLAREMLRLINRPNPRTSRYDLCRRVVTDLYCAGEVFIWRIAPDSGPNAGRPTASGGSLAILSPGHFLEFVRDRRTLDVTGYRFKDIHGRYFELTTEEVLHIRIYNPNDEERGLPLLQGAARALEQMEAADAWNKSLYEGGGREVGYFVPQNLGQGETLTPEQVLAAQESADRATVERRHKQLPQVMTGAFKYERASMTLKDADFLKANQQNMRYIASTIGVFPTMLGDEKGGSLTDAGVDSETRATILFTVLPLVDLFLTELNEWLSDLYGGSKLAYDRDQMEVLNEDVNAIYKRLVEASGGPILTKNEAREAINYDTLPDPEYDKIGGSSSTPSAAPAEREDPPAQPNPGGDGAVVPARSIGVDIGGVRAAIRARYSGVN